ncbi:tetratricopeptide repeat protein [Flavobacterium sp. PL02]|uniref:tetratricopeptide repeat protein n=1 Tax=Flavobacterium sp. PL02 TaxID=3088354 RepID=UPI002B238EDF|nr:tetratricopeptide repeat protein [Flavobacterium sp. PL02]MEA9413396.1 tetratricopeptide repeat protein [Flavobacterium sp. PL02]
MNGDTKYLKNGAVVYVDYRGLVPHGHNFFPKDFPELIIDLDKLYKKTNDIDYLSDKGYLLIVLGKYQEALKLYLGIEKIKPNRYSTASNLGTLYELIGENEKAYQWIKKSIQINPESHKGSEWLHLKILEAKVKHIENVTGQFLIDESFGEEASPKTDLSKKELEELAQSIYFQVNERISFIKPKDKVISVLLFELGNAVKIIGENENAIRIYNLSKEYGFQDELINSRLVYCHQSQIKKLEELNQKMYGVIEKVKKSKQVVDIDEMNQMNQMNQMNTIVIVLSIVSVSLLIGLVIFYFKWKNLKNLTN